MSLWAQKLQEAIENPWMALGLLGQVLFFCRWLVQWYASEKLKKSHVPLSFWYISLAGATLVLVYAIQEANPVFMIGQLVGILNYSRNIMLIHKHRVSRDD